MGKAIFSKGNNIHEKMCLHTEAVAESLKIYRPQEEITYNYNDPKYKFTNNDKDYP